MFLDGAAAVYSYDADSFVDAFASASGLDPADVEVETSVRWDLTLDGMTEVSGDVQDILVTALAGLVGVHKNAVSIMDLSGDIRNRLSHTMSMEIVAPTGSSVVDIVASVEGTSDAVLADLAEHAGTEVAAAVEVTGLVCRVTATAGDSGAMEAIQHGDDFFNNLDGALDARGEYLVSFKVDGIVRPLGTLGFPAAILHVPCFPPLASFRHFLPS